MIASSGEDGLEIGDDPFGVDRSLVRGASAEKAANFCSFACATRCAPNARAIVGHGSWERVQRSSARASLASQMITTSAG
jgi:hypothetical protein